METTVRLVHQDKREIVETKDFVDWMDYPELKESQVSPVLPARLVFPDRQDLLVVDVAHLDPQDLLDLVVTVDCPVQRDWTDSRETLAPVDLWDPREAQDWTDALVWRALLERRDRRERLVILDCPVQWDLVVILVLLALTDPLEILVPLELDSKDPRETRVPLASPE